MNNSYDTSADAELQAIIQETYEGYIENLTSICTIALLLYTSILSLAQEKEYVWSKHFSLPNLLYLFTRYGGLITRALSFALYFQQLGSLCNIIANASNAIFILSYVGVQGLLVARAYSLCHEHKVVAGALAFLFLGEFTLSLYVFSGCLTLPLNAKAELINIFTNINTVLVDLLVFGICLWKVWDTWKLKRETGIQSSNDLVSIFIKQIISRFCFVVLISATSTIFELSSKSANVIIQSDLPIIQQALSVILIAEFTLDLRQRNSAATGATSVALPTIQIQSMLQYVHESIVADMGDHDHENTRAGGDDVTRIRSADNDIESAQDEGAISP